MQENNYLPKNKKTVRNVALSLVVSYVSFFPFIAVLDRSILTKPSLTPRVTVGNMLALGLTITTGIVFYKWLTRRNNR